LGKAGRSSCLPAIHSAFLLAQTTQPKDRVLQSDLTFVGEEDCRRRILPPCSILNLLQCQRFLYQCCLVMWIYKESLPPFGREEIISKLENCQFQVLWDKSESMNRRSWLFPKYQITISIILHQFFLSWKLWVLWGFVWFFFSQNWELVILWLWNIKKPEMIIINKL
jgi:hypothetical protein